MMNDGLEGKEPEVRRSEASSEFVDGRGLLSLRSGAEQGFNPAHGFGREQNVPAKVANLGRNVIDDDHLTSVSDRVDDRARFVRARASLNRALHGWLLLSRILIRPGSAVMMAPWARSLA